MAVVAIPVSVIRRIPHSHSFPLSGDGHLQSLASFLLENGSEDQKWWSHNCRMLWHLNCKLVARCPNCDHVTASWDAIMVRISRTRYKSLSFITTEWDVIQQRLYFYASLHQGNADIMKGKSSLLSLFITLEFCNFCILARILLCFCISGGFCGGIPGSGAACGAHFNSTQQQQLLWNRWRVQPWFPQ